MPLTPHVLDPIQLISGAFSFPLVSLLIASVIVGGILLFAPGAVFAATRTWRTESGTLRYAPEHRTLGAVAIAVIVLSLAEFVVRGYVIAAPDLIHWWRFATPIAGTVVGLIIVLGVIVTRGTTSPDVPVMTAARRDWRSFSSGAALAGIVAAMLVLLATTVVAGLASSSNDEGQYVWLAIPIPNESAIDPIRLPFYGWTYGVPVLICLAALGAASWAALARNAARPYSRPEFVAVERGARRATAVGVTRIATAATILALAGTWRLVADAGSVSQLTITGQNEGAPYEAAWRYAELATAAGWLAPLLEILAFVLLLLAAVGGLAGARGGLEPSEGGEASMSAEVVR